MRGRLVRRQQDRVIAVNGLGWPAQARRAHPQRTEYARKALYAYAPCADLRGVDYIDGYVASYFRGSWAEALRQFVEDDLNCWCTVWIRRNYEVLNPLEPEPQLLAHAAPREAAPRFLFEDTDDRVVDGHPEVVVEQDNAALRAPAASMEPDVQSAQASIADVFSERRTASRRRRRA